MQCLRARFTITADPETVGGHFERQSLRADIGIFVGNPVRPGLNGGRYDLPQLSLKSMMESIALNKLSAAMLLFDLPSAFTSLVRSFVMHDGGCQSDEELAVFLSRAGMPGDLLTGVMGSVEDVAGWQANAVSEHAEAWTLRMMQHTWFTTDVLPGVVGIMKKGLSHAAP